MNIDIVNQKQKDGTEIKEVSLTSQIVPDYSKKASKAKLPKTKKKNQEDKKAVGESSNKAKL